MNKDSAARRRARQLRSRRAGARGRYNPGDQAVIRLVICGIIFVLLVAIKLLFPQAASSLARSAGQLIGRDADFKEAFAAMGRAISGEAAVSDSLQDAYTAVFSPSPQPTGKPAGTNSGSAAPSNLDPGAKLVRYTTSTLPVAVDTAAIMEVTVEPEPPAVPKAPEGGVPPAAAVSQPETAPAAEDDTTTTPALSYIYTMPAMPDNASLEQRNLGFDHCTPVHGALSSAFGWREHPVEGGSRFHYGVDLAAEEGTDILAFADGTVYATGESSTLGNYIMLQHRNGYITLYAHCSRVTATGGSVSKGDKIAEVGATGLVTGPHLHFELHDGDLYLNPIFYVEIG